MAFPLTTEEADAILKRINDQEELIVGAAVRTGDGAIVFHPIPARHDSSINYCYKHKLPQKGKNPECGFITNKGRFVDRVEAGRIVLASNQGTAMYAGTKTNPQGALHSEDMWLCEWTDPRQRGTIKAEEVF